MAAYGEGMKLSDLFELYRYIRERTNLSKDEDDLTDQQLAWKQMYKTILELMMSKMDDEGKKHVETMEGLYHAHDIMNDVIEAQRVVETLFFQQEVLFSFYENKSDPESDYHVQLDKATKTMLASTDPKEALRIAHEILKLVGATKEMLVGGIKRLQQELQEGLEVFAAASEKSNALVAAASEGTENTEASPNDEWTTLSKDLFNASISRTDLLVKEFALDAKFATNVVDRNGVNPNEMSEKEKQGMTELVVETGALKMTVLKTIHEINTKRQPLNPEVFGGEEQYTALTNEAAKTVTKWLSRPQN